MKELDIKIVVIKKEDTKLPSVKWAGLKEEDIAFICTNCSHLERIYKLSSDGLCSSCKSIKEYYRQGGIICPVISLS